MTVTLHPVIYYRSKSEDWNDAWQQHDWIALNLVRAVKHKPFNGSSRIVFKGGRVVVIDSSDGGRDRALSLMCGELAKKIAEAGYEQALIVPIPASDHTNPARPFTGSRIAAGIQAKDPSFVATPALYFSEPIPKSSAGGGRDAALIQSKLRDQGTIPAGTTVVLIDDVFTTGAHIKAAARYLRAKGITVSDAFVVARTRWERPPHMLKAADEELAF